MSQMTVKIAGVSRGAALTWNQNLVPLVDMGGGNLSASFTSVPGNFLYAIVVFGSPGDPWTATLTDGTTTHNHAGHMSPSGYDTTGDTAFPVQ
jgi:hypothetical protein